MTTRPASLIHRRPGDMIRHFEVLDQLSRPVDTGQSQVYLVRRKAAGQPSIDEVLRTIKANNASPDYIAQQQVCVLKLATPSWEDNLRVEHNHLRTIDGTHPRLVELSTGFGPTGDTSKPGPKGFGWADLRDEQGARVSLPFILTAFYSGGSLLHLLNREQRRPLPIPFAVQVALQVAEALVALQNPDLVHHDISPHNIVFRNTVFSLQSVPDCVLIDFAASDSPSARRPTRQAGKPHYLPPQRLAAQNPMPLSWRIDLYSLGVVLYEMLVGDLPRRTDVHTGLPLPLPPLTDQRTDVSPELASLVMATVSHQPAQWPQSLSSFRASLAAIPELTQQTPPALPQRRWTLIGGVAAVALAAAIGLGAFASQSSSSYPSQSHGDPTVTPIFVSSTPTATTTGPAPTSTSVVKPLP